MISPFRKDFIFTKLRLFEAAKFRENKTLAKISEFTVIPFIFQNQFKSNFVAALDSAPKIVPIGVHAPQNPDPEPHIVPLRKRKKTRWE